MTERPLHPVEYERARRAVALAIGDGHVTRATIIGAVREHLPVHTAGLVTCALHWLDRNGRAEFERGVGWRLRPPQEQS